MIDLKYILDNVRKADTANQTRYSLANKPSGYVEHTDTSGTITHVLVYSVLVTVKRQNNKVFIKTRDIVNNADTNYYNLYDDRYCNLDISRLATDLYDYLVRTDRINNVREYLQPTQTEEKPVSPLARLAQFLGV